MKLQEAFQQFFPDAWVKGRSICYNNLSWAANHKTRNFKFENVRMTINDIAKEEEFKQVLVDNGFKPKLIIIDQDMVQIWMEKEAR